MSLAHAAPRAAPQRLGSTSGLRARPGGNAARVSRAVRAQAATPGGHNHRPSSPQKPRPSAPNLRRVVDGASSPATAQAQAQGTSVENGPDPSRSTPRAATRTRAAASTTAGFQRTSWYGAVSSAIPGVGVVARASPDAGAGPGPGGSGVNINPTVVKQGSGSNPAAAPKPTPAAATKTEPKPFKDPSAGGGELALPRESDKPNKRKPAGLTRLLRTPLSGASPPPSFVASTPVSRALSHLSFVARGTSRVRAPPRRARLTDSTRAFRFKSLFPRRRRAEQHEGRRPSLRGGGGA